MREIAGGRVGGSNNPAMFLMCRPKIVALAAVMLAWTYGPYRLGDVSALTLSDKVRELLRDRVEYAGVPAQCSIEEEVICASLVLPRFYERRAYQPAWIGEDELLPQVDALVRAIHGADREGLRPSDYHLAAIEGILKEVLEGQEQNRFPDPGKLVDLELLLTDAFLLYGSHLLSGKVDPESLHAQWLANRREADLADVLETALDLNQIEETLEKLLPPHPGYAKLRQALAHYRRIAANGGWPEVPNGPSMREDDRSERVAALRRRLIVQGYLGEEQQADEELFDHALDQAVRRFQQQYGLDIDGIVGSKTLAALNAPVEKHSQQIELNMERWRWLPQDLGQRYVLVNIANFELKVAEKGEQVMSMRVVVGRPYRRTPVFSDKMTYLVLNPFWNVPHSIAVKDKLPLIRKNTDYLVAYNFKVLEGWGASAREIDTSTIDWSRITARHFSYRLRQEPGPMNALGRIKFMFPNRFNVYLHDTPSQELFSETKRTFSSGCIRIERPIDLAEYVMRGDPRWAREGIVAAIDQGRRETLRLPEPIPVHLLYWTVWADENGTAYHRNDIYGRDEELYKAFREEPPVPQ